INKPIGLRDRAILETLYSTALRRLELCNLMVYDLNATNGTVMVRQGKGKKDRVIPIGDRALTWVEKYLTDARPMLSRSLDDGPLFVTNTGKPMSPNRLTQLCRDYIKRANINKGGACHAFRHSCATLMLEGGADVRYIQAQLGHVQLSSTQIYTKVSVTKLKEVHSRT
ncbi:MAG: tyrosine-type recombinase/integrase, partial [Deltaproteobacteria bacterium]|nr:tyrosine-type recombinase/integrase [Deltaproteobacteria bacterium]